MPENIKSTLTMQASPQFLRKRVQSKKRKISGSIQSDMSTMRVNKKLLHMRISSS